MQTAKTDILSSPSLVVEKYFDMVYRLARKTAGADKADDAVQNVFVRYMNHYTEFDSEEHVKAWLIRVTYNCCVSELKNSWESRTTGLPEEDSSSTLAAPEPDPESERAAQLTEAVDRLPAKYRTVIHLYYYEEYSTKEIAKAINKKEATVRTLLARGRTQLEKILKEGQLL